MVLINVEPLIQSTISCDHGDGARLIVLKQLFLIIYYTLLEHHCDE